MSALEQFRDAVADGDEVRAIDLSTDMLDEVDTKSEGERGIERVARSIVMDASSSDELIQAADSLTDALIAAEEARTSLAYLVIGLAKGRFDRDAALETTDRVLERRKQVNQAKSELRETSGFEDVESKLVAYTSTDSVAIPKGTKETVTFSVENSGGSPASNVSLTHESEVDVHLAPEVIESIEPGETTSVDVFVPESTPDGQFDVRVLVQRETGNDTSIVISIHVRSKVDFVRRALRGLDDIEDLIVDLLEEHDRSDRPFRRRIQTIRRDLEAVREGMQSGEIGEKDADKRIRQNHKRTKGLIGQIKSLNEVPDGSRAALRTDAVEIRELLEQGMVAEI